MNIEQLGAPDAGEENEPKTEILTKEQIEAREAEFRAEQEREQREREEALAKIATATDELDFFTAIRKAKYIETPEKTKILAGDLISSINTALANCEFRIANGDEKPYEPLNVIPEDFGIRAKAKEIAEKFAKRGTE